ncbi:MAG: hypothetical protein A2Y40_02995 [Candidatus Margulisbacteria bacterium GWF2_35_9]|nr:MAG: hypothetical protein A2Y40_02995 [Candidatus Margulisbacteria bacterium GWF2_35_9]
MRIEKITSNQNDKFKLLGHLHQKKWRDKTTLFIVEGKKEIKQALKNDYIIESIWFVESKQQDVLDLEPLIGEKIYGFQITEDMFSKIGYREKTEGIIAVFQQKKLQVIKGGTNRINNTSLIIVADNIEKPGNIGALFRTADGVGAAGLILTNQIVDIYNPNIIRNSVGTFFSVPFFIMETKDAWDWLTEQSYKIVIASPQSQTMYYEADMRGNIAIILGNEHSGVSKSWEKRESLKIKIPMNGVNDSLNVSVSSGIISYEWFKQNQSS